MRASIERSLFALLLSFSFPTLSDGMVYTTWNIEWLTSEPSAQFASSHRNSGDFDALNRHFQTISSDVLAFQEVNDLPALKRVVGSEYQMVLSHRSQSKNQQHQFSDINQYTGFAIRKGITFTNQDDLKLDSQTDSKLRFATYIVIDTDDMPLHALSVHLKARCSGAYRNNRDCQILKQQGASLNQWIQNREKNDQPYVILGDFNHNLSYSGDWLWEIISQRTSAVLASKKSEPLCKVKSRNNPNRTHQFRSLIDHIVVSKDIATSQPVQNVYSSKDVLRYQLSDHCPLTTTLE